LNRPGVDELVDFLRSRGYLRIALRDVNDLRAGCLTEPSKRLVGVGFSSGDQLLECATVDPGRSGNAFLEHRRRDFDQRSLGEMADQPRVRTVVEDGRWTGSGRRIEPA